MEYKARESSRGVTTRYEAKDSTNVTLELTDWIDRLGMDRVSECVRKRIAWMELVPIFVYPGLWDEDSVTVYFGRKVKDDALDWLVSSVEKDLKELLAQYNKKRRSRKRYLPRYTR